MDDQVYMALEEYCRRLAARLGLQLTCVKLRNKPALTGYRMYDASSSKTVPRKGAVMTLGQVVDLLEEKDRRRRE